MSFAGSSIPPSGSSMPSEAGGAQPGVYWRSWTKPEFHGVISVNAPGVDWGIDANGVFTCDASKAGYFPSKSGGGSTKPAARPEPNYEAHGTSPEEYFATKWTTPGLCRRCDQFPDAPFKPSAATGSGVKLVTCVSPLVSDIGLQAVQQDVGLVQGVGGGVPVIVLCDGHGTVPMLQVADPNSTAKEGRDMVQVGGRQAAQIACEAIIEYIKQRADEFQLHYADLFIHSAFVHAHKVILENIRMGSRDTDPEGSAVSSRVDGQYFQHMATLMENNKGQEGSLVARKVTTDVMGNGADGAVTYYQRNNGTWSHADFGTSCTMVTVLNAPDAQNQNRKVVVTAHAGDSHVCLLRFVKGELGPNGKPKLKYAKWLTAEHSMYNEVEALRPMVRGGVVFDVMGTDKQVQVGVKLPNGEISAASYEQTRALGHCQGQFVGIVPTPSVSCAQVEHDDIIVVGSSGLWTALGGRRQKGDMSPPKEDLTNPLLSNLLHVIKDSKHKQAHDIAKDILVSARLKGLKDNTTLAVIKMDQKFVGGAGGGSSKDMPSAPPQQQGSQKDMMRSPESPGLQRQNTSMFTSGSVGFSTSPVRQGSSGNFFQGPTSSPTSYASAPAYGGPIPTYNAYADPTGIPPYAQGFAQPQFPQVYTSTAPVPYVQGAGQLSGGPMMPSPPRMGSSGGFSQEEMM